MVVTVQQLATLVQGQVHGDGAQIISDARPLNEAGSGHVTFLEHERLARHLKTCSASAVLVPPALRARQQTNGAATPVADGTALTFIEVADPLNAFIAVVRHFRGADRPRTPQVATQAIVHPTAQVGPEASIDPFAVVGEGTVIGARCRIGCGAVVGRNCRLGDDVTLHPRVVLYDGTIVGHRVELHAGAVIGADGFGYRCPEGRHVKVQQFGVVEIGDDVEIGANSTVDRGTFHNTRIGAGTKIDNQVQVGHNCQIGKHNLIVSQVGIAGSASTGDYVVLAGQAGLADHIHVGDRVVVGAQSGVYNNVPAGERMLGAPARPEGEQKRILLCLDKLPELRREMRRVSRHLGIENGNGHPPSET